MAVEGENLGTAVIYLTVDKTSMDATIGKAKLQLAGMGAEASKQYDAMSVGQQKMAQSMVRQVEMIGKTRAEQIAYNAQLKIGGALGDEIAAKAVANAQAVGAAQDKQAASAAMWTDAQLLKANQALAAYVAQTDAAKAAEAAQAEMAATDAARFKQIAADAMAEVEARQAVTAATIEQARANAALAEASGVGATGGAAQAISVLDSVTVQQQIADYAALDAIMGKKVATTEEVAAAEAALDRLQAAGMLSNEELAASFEALNVVTAAETKSLQANSAAQVENAAATTVNSRTQYELGIMLGEVASGNVNRLKRSGAALANSTGLLRAIMTPAGLAISGVVAALGSLVVAAGKGEAEFANFNKTLIMTGDYAGITFTQYRQMAESLAESGTSIGKAKDALSALAATGKFTGDQLGTAAQAVLNMAQLTGQSVDQAVASIVKLREDPVKAIEALTDQYHFLSTATLQRIQQLQDQGNKEDAANLAEKTYADALRTRAADMEKNLGTLQAVWRSLGESASWAWDKMQGIGRPTTTLDDLGAQYDKLLQFRMSVSDRMAGKGTLGDFLNAPDAIGGKSTSGMSLQQQLAAIDAELAKVRGDTKPLQDAANAAAQSKADASALQQAGNEGVETLTKLGVNLDGIKNKQDKVREAATALFNVWQAGGKLPKGVSFTGPIADVPVGAGWDAIKKQLLKGDPGVKAAEEQAKQAAAALVTFQSQVDGLTNKSTGVEGDAALTKYVQGVAKLTDEFDKATAKGANVTAATAAFDQGVKALNATLDKNEQQLKNKNTAAIDAYKASLDKSVEAQKESLDAQIASMTMGQKEYQQLQQKNRILADEATQLEHLAVQYHNALAQKDANPAAQKAIYEQDVANLKTATTQKLANLQDYFNKSNSLQADWLTGAIVAMKNWADQGANVADQAKTLFTDAFTQMNDALVNFVQTGKLSFSQLADSIIADLVRMELRIVESQILQSILGAFMPSGASIASSYMAGGGASYAASGVNWDVGALGHAKGGVYNSPSLSRYSGGVYDSPQFFKFASGGVFGEAGPEAIMPLSRGSDGKLGVKSAGGGNTTVIVENHSDNKAQVQQSKDSNGGDIIKVIVGQAVSEVDKRIARGGSTGQIMQQAFGLSRRGIPVAG